ncbi:hypothetical protein ACFQZ4_34620 [Catellatospora coxensis]
MSGFRRGSADELPRAAMQLGDLDGCAAWYCAMVMACLPRTCWPMPQPAHCRHCGCRPRPGGIDIDRCWDLGRGGGSSWRRM